MLIGGWYIITTMKKKLLLLPITLMSLFLAGCGKKEVDPVYIEDWLSSAKSPKQDINGTLFSISSQSGYMYDYDLEVRDLLSSNINNNCFKGKGSSKKSDRECVVYAIRANVGRLEFCNIFVYDDGKVITEAFPRVTKFNNIKEQVFNYSISEESARYVISQAKERYDQITKEMNNEHQAAREAYNPANFFTSLDEATQDPFMQYKETREGYETTTFLTVDTGRNILTDLKGLTYTYLENYSIDLVPMVKYYVSEDYQLQIFCGWSQANQHKYDGKYETSLSKSYVFYYQIDAVQGENIVNKIRATQGIE